MLMKWELVSSAPIGVPVISELNAYVGFTPANVAEAIASGTATNAETAPESDVGRQIFAFETQRFHLETLIHHYAVSISSWLKPPNQFHLSFRAKVRRIYPRMLDKIMCGSLSGSDHYLRRPARVM